MLTIQQDSLKVKHMQRALELGLPDERNKGSDTENKGVSLVEKYHYFTRTIKSHNYPYPHPNRTMSNVQATT